MRKGSCAHNSNDFWCGRKFIVFVYTWYFVITVCRETKCPWFLLLKCVSDETSWSTFEKKKEWEQQMKLMLEFVKQLSSRAEMRNDGRSWQFLETRAGCLMAASDSKKWRGFVWPKRKMEKWAHMKRDVEEPFHSNIARETAGKITH